MSHGKRRCDNTGIYDNHISVWGNNNSLYGNHCIAYGDNNIVYGNHTKVYGDNTQVYGNHCKIYGSNTESYGNHTKYHSAVSAKNIPKYISDSDGDSDSSSDSDGGGVVIGGHNSSMISSGGGGGGGSQIVIGGRQFSASGGVSVTSCGNTSVFSAGRPGNPHLKIPEDATVTILNRGAGISWFTSDGDLFSFRDISNVKTINSIPRQDFVAAIQASKQPGPTATTSPDPMEAIKDTTSEKLLDDAPDDQACCVCSENKKTICFVPCGHLCCCPDCAKRLVGDGEPQCPICRKGITKAVHAFM